MSRLDRGQAVAREHVKGFAEGTAMQTGVYAPSLRVIV
jgi:hypothetical protein